MALHTFGHSSAPLRRVKTIQFGILSPDEIKGLSVAKIEYPETYEEGSQKPKIGGLSDTRLGTIDRNFKCETCGEGMAECPGHFGHLEVRRYAAGLFGRPADRCHFCSSRKVSIMSAFWARSRRYWRASALIAGSSSLIRTSRYYTSSAVC
jgi:DNA-directed RNA polymerase II subunit RPB1